MPAMETLIKWLDAERGRRMALAEALGVNASAISQWARVPIERTVAVEGITGIPRHVLRPDIFQIGEEQAA